MGVTETGTEMTARTETTAGTDALPAERGCPRCGRTFPAAFLFCEDDATPLVGTAQAEDGRAGHAPAADDTVGSEDVPEAGRASDAKAPPDRRPLIVGAAGLAVLVAGALAWAAHRPAKPPSPAVASAVAATVKHPAAGGGRLPAAQGASGPARGDAGSGAEDGDGGDATATVARWRTYQNPALGFRVDYPDGWTPTGPTRDDGSLLVRFVAPDPHLVVLVDVDSPGSGRTPLGRWQDFDARFARSYKDRYRPGGIEPTTLGGAPASRWTFRLRKKGQPDLEKEDVGAHRAGSDYALLCGAPTGDFPRWRAAFDHVTGSFAWLR